MKFSIRMLLLLMLVIALLGSALLNRNRRIQYTREVSVLKEASRRHARELKSFQRRSEFLQKVLTQRQFRKAEFETALATFDELADRYSRIEPDESGRWFARSYPQYKAGGIRVWIPESAKLQVVVGFADLPLFKPNSSDEVTMLRDAKEYFPAEVWTCPLPAGESTIEWKWIWTDRTKGIGEFHVVVNDHAHVLEYKNGETITSQWVNYLSEQKAFAADKPHRLFGIEAGTSHNHLTGKPIYRPSGDQIQIGIEPLETGHFSGDQGQGNDEKSTR